MLPLAAPDLSGIERENLLAAFDSGYLTHQGAWEDRFESEFSKWIGRPSICTSSGTGALHCSLLALGVGHGDEVILPALCFGAAPSVVIQCGAKPVLVDIEEDFGLNWNWIRSKLTRRTKAILAVHNYGPCPMPTADMGVPIVEDACEALGMINPVGHYTVFSFYGNKMMTTGEGGMICGKDAEKARPYRDGGFDRDYDMLVAGLNYRMTNLQAAIGCAQLARVDQLVAKRLANAQEYGQILEGRGSWLFVAKVENPVHVAEELKRHGYESRPVFRPLHLTRAFRQDGKFKVAEDVWAHGICLPTGPHVSIEQVQKIAEIVKDGNRHIRPIADSSRKLAT